MESALEQSVAKRAAANDGAALDRRTFLKIAAVLGLAGAAAALGGCAGPDAGEGEPAERAAEVPASGQALPPEASSGENGAPASAPVAPGEGAAVLRVRLASEGLDATVSLGDSPAARAFAELLPLTVDMGDLNGNEKYAYLETALPTAAYAPGYIEAGDVMLYGSNCVVVFYASHTSSYPYTRLGRVDDPAALAAIAGAPTASFTFEAA